METILYLSLCLNLIFIGHLVHKKIPKRKNSKKDEPLPITPVVEQKPHSQASAALRVIADVCERQLEEKDRGKVKLLVHEDDPQHLAALQIGELRISLRRNNENLSLFHISSFRAALELARNGYCVKGFQTARYIPVPKEIEFILSQRHIINVYLKTMGLEQISEKDDFWCVDTETGWNTGWNRFGWNTTKAYDKLHRKSRVRTSDGNYIPQVACEDKVSLFLLLKGWEHLYFEA